MIRWQRKGKERHPARTWMVRIGIALTVASGMYLIGGMAGLFPLELETVVWNNIRIVSGAMILGCLLAAVGYGNE